MKLLIVSHSCAEASNQRLFARLRAATGWEVSLVIPARWKDEFGNTLDKPPSPGLEGRVRKVPVLGNGNIILHAYRLRWRAFLDREQFDLIYINHEPYALATAQVAFANIRFRHPAVMGFYSCQNLLKSYPFPFPRLERMVYRHSRFAFPITPAVAGVLRAKGYEGLQSVCPLPFDPDFYFPRDSTENAQRLPRESGETVIGYVGRLVEAKGLRTLVLALTRIRDLQWKLVVIGSGPFEETLRGLLAEGGIAERVQLAGYVPHDETPAYLSAFDFLVLPSETQPNWKEQFGRVITESLACGRPVVGSDSGEIPNLIRNSGGGLVFREKDVGALAEALRSMIHDTRLRKRCGAVGKAWADANVSLDAVARCMASTMEDAAADP